MKRILRSLAILALMFVPLATQAQVDCDEYAELPWSSGFEGLQTGQVPACWVQVQTGTNPGLNATFPSAYVHAPNAHNGSVYFEFESTTGQTEVLALPRMEYVSELQLSFWASAVNINFMLEAGVVEEDGEGNYTFVPVDTVNVIQGSSFSGGYHIYNITFENYEGDGERLALRVHGNSNAQYTLMIDDFSVIYAGTPILAPMQAQYTANVNFPLTIAAVLQTGTNVNYDWFSQMAEAGNAEMESNDSLLTITYTAAGIDTIMVVAYNNGGEDTGYTAVHVIDLSPVTEFPYTTSFEEGDDVNWQFANGTNGWHLGTATHNGEGSRALYISNDEGVSNSYSITATTSSYAYRPVGLESGEYALQYDWLCNGESSYDYLRVFLAPGSTEFVADNTSSIGTTGAPSGWISLDGNSKLNGSSSWQTCQSTFTVANGGLYHLVLYWRNDYTTGTQPPAAVDNITLSQLTCPSVTSVQATGVTAHEATIVWTPLGEESQWWVVVDGDEANGQMVSEASFELTGLNGQSTHTVSVRAYCGEGDTSFATNVTFTTPVSCPVVSALQAVNVGPHVATINWNAGGEESEWLVVVDGDMDNAEVVTETTYFIEGLNSESSHTVIVRAVCGESDTSANATVNFTTLVSCPAPTGFAAALTPGNGSVATLNWTEVGEASTWQICMNNDMTDLITVDETPTYSFTDLTPEQTYTAKVRAICGELDTSAWTSTISFTPTNAYNITVAEGTATNGYVPVYGFYADAYLKSHHVYPAEQLEAMTSGSITQMTFYSSTSSASWGNAHFKVYVGEVESTTISAFANVADLTMVYEGSLSINGGTMTVEFDEPYTYEGGNLLVAVENTVTGSYVSCTWLGVTANGASVQGYNYSSLSGITASQRNFIPKTTFDYVPGDGVFCAKPANFASSDITAHEATFSWEGEADNYVFEYKKATDVEWTVEELSEMTITITDLTAETAYNARVKAVCDEETESGYRTLNFTTLVACPAVTNAHVSEITPYSATIEWTIGAEEEAWMVYVDGDQEGELVEEPMYVLGDLEPVSAHTVVIKAYCGEEDFSTAVTVNCTTLVACPAPAGLAATLTPGNGTIATLSWNAQGATAWQICLNNDMENLIDVTETASYDLTNLTAEQTYTAKVRTVCSDEETSEWSNTISFTPTNSYTITVADGTTTSSYVPVYGLWCDDYVKSHFVYPADNLAVINGGMITSLKFYISSPASSVWTGSFKVYLGEVDGTTISAYANVEELTQVYDGQLDGTGATMTIEFEEEYLYGGGNLLVAVEEYQPGSWSSCYFYGITANGASIYGYSSSSLASVSATQANFLPKTTFGFIPGGPVCHTPAISGTEATETTVTVNFNGSANSYEVAIVAGSWVAPAEGTTISTTTHTFSNLTPSTQYAVGVRALCDDDLVSNWAVVTVSTLESTAECLAPSNVVVSNVSMTGATVTWTAADAAQTAWEVNVTGLNYDQTLTASATTLAVDGLTSGVEYTVKVRAVCGEENYSEWSDAASFTTGVCEAVSNVIVSNITANSATVAWTAAEGQTSWQLDYGPQGHPQGTGATVVVNTNPYTLSGLEEYTPYDIYVRAICSDGVFSDWSIKANFTTLQTEGIEGVNSDLVKLYPNPASTTVTVSGISGEATVSVVDMNGRTVYSERANETLTIDLSGYAQGAYFVRISGEQTLAIRKLIVK